MAKMFYTLDETKAALGKSEEDVKQLTREGRLREFRDGPRLMFKADQVEQLKAELGGGSMDHVELAPSGESGAPIGLVDSRGASGSGLGISLADSEGPSVSGSGLQMQMKDDTALAQDLGLSGSVGGLPSPSRGGSVSGSGVSMTGTGIGMAGSGLTGSGLAGSGLGGSVAGGTMGRGGVNVFSADDSVEHADPGAQTAITPTDQVNLEGVGSGSGLLDLTRESDDTSLGAELLDEIAPGTGKAARQQRRAVDSGGADALAEPRRGVTAPPVYVEAIDPTAPAYAMMALGATIFSLIGALVLACAIVGSRPAVIDTIAGKTSDNRPIWMIALIGVVICAILAIIGLIAGKSARR